MTDLRCKSRKQQLFCCCCFQLCEKHLLLIWSVKALLMVKMFLEEARGGKQAMKCTSEEPGFSFTCLLPAWDLKQTTLPEWAPPPFLCTSTVLGGSYETVSVKALCNLLPRFSKFISEWYEIIKNIKTWTLLSFVPVDMSPLCCDLKSCLQVCRR